jgi:heptosyltransferase III
MVDALKRNFPEAKIDFLVNKRVYELVCDYPNINKVHSIEKVTVNEVKSLSKAGNYDLAIVVHPRFSIALGLFLGGVKHRLGTAYRWYSFLFNIKQHQHRKHSTKHELEYNLDLLDELNCDRVKEIWPVLKVEDEHVQKVQDKLKGLGVDLSKPIITVHIPSLGSAKVWSDKNFTSLINMINQNKDLDVNIVLTGTVSDSAQLENILNQIENKNDVFHLLDLNLKELSALLRLSKLFIGNSTGPIHIAAAVGTYCVGLYSPVKVESSVRWGPYTDKRKIFQPERDDNSGDVMDDIKPEVVFEFVKQKVNNK